jgi:hypothetical protein
VQLFELRSITAALPSWTPSRNQRFGVLFETTVFALVIRVYFCNLSVGSGRAQRAPFLSPPENAQPRRYCLQPDPFS